jgi:hypothetical protein
MPDVPGIGKAFHRDYWGMPRWKACNEYTVNFWKCETCGGNAGQQKWQFDGVIPPAARPADALLLGGWGPREATWPVELAGGAGRSGRRGGRTGLARHIPTVPRPAT